METIGLIAAMTQESHALLRLIKGQKRISLGPYSGVSFQAGNRICVLITSGMGIKRASDAARVLVELASPQLLISFGIAGAVTTNLQIGDVVVSGKSCLLVGGIPVRFQPLAILSDVAREAVAEALYHDEAGLYVGTAITTHGSQAILREIEDMPHPILEMETAGIAQVAAEHSIPLLSLRSISDGPQAPIPIDLEAAMDENDNLRIGSLIAMVLHHPKIIFMSARMMRNSRIAANHTALALIAALNQPLSLVKG
jgi:adenosylhomocysteine nucleosidase